MWTLALAQRYITVSMVNNRPLTVLVTGGAGYIGSHTLVDLLNEGHEVIVTDNCSCGSPPMTDPIHGDNGIEATSPVTSKIQLHCKPPSIIRVEELTAKQVIYYNISTMDEIGLKQVFKKHRINVVLHLAALKAVAESVRLPLHYYTNNVTGTINLLKVMDEANVKCSVFSSSATVYGNPQWLPIDEEHPTGQNITNPYGQSKYMCEQIMKDLATSDQGWRFIFLRYFNPVGAHKSGLIGEDPMGIPNNLMPFISQVAVGRRPHLEVFGNDYDTRDGSGVRDYIHVMDLSHGHVLAVNKIMEGDFRGWKAYNLGTGSGISVLEMVKEFSSVCGQPVPYVVSPRRSGDVASVIATCDKAKTELGWVRRMGVKEMCEDTWRWQQMNPNGYTTANGV